MEVLRSGRIRSQTDSFLNGFFRPTPEGEAVGDWSRQSSEDLRRGQSGRGSGSTTPRAKIIRIHTAEPEGGSFSLAIYESMELAALLHAVAARANLNPDQFFLTCTNCNEAMEEEEPVVPLSAALPDGLELLLHRVLANPEPVAAFATFEGRQVSATAAPHQEATPSATTEAEAFENFEPLRLRATSAIDMRPPKPSDARRNSPRSAEPLSTAEGDVQSRSEPASGPLSCAALPYVDERDHPGAESSLAEPLLRATSADRQQPASPRQLIRRRTSFWRSKPEEQTGTSTLDAVERFSRLTADQSNERTLLAWTRTSLAAVRTVFSYGMLTGGDPENLLLLISKLIVAVLVIVFSSYGHFRYSALKEVINTKNPPRSFGRTSVRYINALVIFASFAITTGTFLQPRRHE